MSKLFGINFTYTEEGVVHVKADSEESALAAISNELSTEVKDFKITNVEILLENADQLINETKGVLN